MLLLGTGEVFADTASGTLLPMVVAKEDLGIGNARLMAGVVTQNQLIGPAVGAGLFAAGIALPFMTQALLVALGVVLVLRMRVPAMEEPAREAHVVRDIREGLRWTWNHTPVRTLTLAILIFNVTWGAAWSVLVLYASERLGLGAVGFGLLTSVVAVGGLLGTLSYDWLERHARLASLMRICLLTETFTHLGLALTTSWRVAAAIMFVFGAYAFVWGTLSGGGADARGADPAAGPGRQRLLPRRVRRHPRRAGGRRRDRPGLGRHRSLLVRLRGLRPHPGLDLACAGRHRARRSGRHGVVVDSVKVSAFEYVPVRSGSLEPIDCWRSTVTLSLLTGPG